MVVIVATAIPVTQEDPMPRTGLTCPHCHVYFQIDIDSVAPKTPRAKPQTNGQITPLSSTALQDVLEVIATIGAGQKTTSAELYRTYMDLAQTAGRKSPLTQYALMLGVKRYGARPWRSSSARGYVMPDPLPTEPLSPPAKAAERATAEQLRAGIREYVAPRPTMSREEEMANLPFAVEGY